MKFKHIFNIFNGDTEISKKRIYVVIYFFLTLFFLVGCRLFDITVLSNKHDFSNEHIPYDVASRRDIVDRNGQLLAINLSSVSVYANPKLINDPENVAKKLKKILVDIDHKALLKKLKSTDRTFVWIRRYITPAEQQQIHNLGIPGITFEKGERRIYPYGHLTSHLIGYVGMDGYGLAGTEKYFDDYLRLNKDDKKESPLTLSIDIRAQSIVEEELNSAIREFSAKGGAGIIQDVNNGELIAMVSLPDYDPYQLSQAKDENLFNKATLGTYELGSVCKAATMAMALDTGKIRLNDVYDVNTPIQTAGYQIKDFQGKGGWLSVPEILIYSSNIGISQIALELGNKVQQDYFKQFGFLSSTDVELMEKASPLHPSLSKWNYLSTITASYGHGISITPLHAVRAMSTIANGGRMYPATIVKTEREPEYKQVIKASTSESMRKLLRMVVKYGSGRKADIKGFYVGGKTGTSNKAVNGKYSKDLRVSTFMASFPMNNPKYTILIMLDEPKPTKSTYGFATGGWTSAPTAGKIIQRVATILNVAPDLANQDAIEQNLFVNYDAQERTS